MKVLSAVGIDADYSSGIRFCIQKEDYLLQCHRIVEKSIHVQVGNNGSVHVLHHTSRDIFSFSDNGLSVVLAVQECQPMSMSKSLFQR